MLVDDGDGRASVTRDSADRYMAEKMAARTMSDPSSEGGATDIHSAPPRVSAPRRPEHSSVSSRTCSGVHPATSTEVGVRWMPE